MIARKADKQRPSTPEYRAGRADNKTAIMLSTAGQAEKKANRPAAARTGENVGDTLKVLHQRDPQDFPSPDLDDYTLLNAGQGVHYRAETGDYEVRQRELSSRENVDRVKQKLADQEVLVALGRKAQAMVELAEFKGTVYEGRHPSDQSINTYYKSDKATPQERRADRIQQYANDICKKRKE